MPRDADSYLSAAKAEAAKENRARHVPLAGPNPLYKQWDKYKTEAKKLRDPWVAQWEEMYRYTMPGREGFYTEAPGQDHTDQNYDETAVVSVPKLASRLAGGYLPEYGEIFSLSYGPDAPAHLRNGEGNEKLEELTRMIHESWQNSNLGVESGDAMLDLAIGTANVLLEAGRYPGDVVFTALDPTMLAILPDGESGLKGWFWWRKLALEDIKELYPRGSFGAPFERALKNDPMRKTMLECATWKVNTDDGSEQWQFVCIVPEFREKDGVIYQRIDSGEGSCPFGYARWSKTGRNPWGRGPILLAMPAIKTCNLTVQMTLENAEYAIGGMWTYDDDGVFDPDSVTFAPGTFIPKSREGKIEPLQSGAQFDVSQLVLAEMRQNIKKALHVDEMDKQGETPYSAFEIAQRRADNARDLTMPGSRITRGLIVAWVNRTIWIFERQGILDAAGLRVDGKRLKLFAKSPFLRGQDAVVMQEIMTAAGQLNAIFGAGTAGMAFRMEQTRNEVFRRNGVPSRLATTKEEIAQMGAGTGAAAGQAVEASGPEAGTDPMALLGPLMKAGQQ